MPLLFSMTRCSSSPVDRHRGAGIISPNVTGRTLKNVPGSEGWNGLGMGLKCAAPRYKRFFCLAICAIVPWEKDVDSILCGCCVVVSGGASVDVC